MAKKAKKKSNIKTSFTNTKGEKVVKTKTGETFRNGVSEGIKTTKKMENGKEVEYRSVMGQNSGSSRQVRVGSGADAKYNEEGLYQGKGAETAKYSTFNRPLQTTTATRKQNQKNMAEYDKFRMGLSTYDQMKKQQSLESAAIANESKKGAGTLPVVDPYDKLSDDERRLKEESDKTINDLTEKYDRMERYSDDATRDLIRATKDLYRSRVAKMERANARALQAKNTTNLRDDVGSARYTPELAAGILSDEEIQGSERIGELEAEMLKTIAEANAARAEGRTKEFGEHFNRLKEVREELRMTLKDNFDRAQAQEKMILDREKEARVAEKEAQEQLMERSKRSAPAIAQKLKEFKSAEERQAFIEAYAEQTGIDPDVLLGDVSSAMDDQTKRSLEIDNIRNQIYNRNRSEDRLQRKADEEEEEIGDSTKNILSGATTLEDLTGAERQKAIADLRELGFYSENPPQWYIEMINDERGQTVVPEDIKKEWETYRNNIVGGV